MKILHFADIHAREKDLDEVKKCCDEILRVAEQEQPDLIVNAGDTFDHHMIRLDSEIARYIFDFHRKLSNIAPVAVVIGTPSHDGTAALALESVSGQHNIIVSSRPEQLILSKDGDYALEDLYRGKDFVARGPVGDEMEAIISMMPAPTKQFFQGVGGIQSTDEQIGQAIGAILAGFGAKASELHVPHVLVGHLQIGGAFVSDSRQLTGHDIEVSTDQLGLAQADLIALGHIHKSQQIGSGIYSGSIYRKDFGELDDKGFYIHDLETQEHRFCLTPTRKLLKIDVDATETLDNVDATIYAYGPEAIENAFVQVVIKCWQDETAKLNVDDVKVFFWEYGAKDVDIRIIRVPRENVRSERILKLSTLRDKIQEQARIKNDSVSDTILLKADSLESVAPDAILEQVSVG